MPRTFTRRQILKLITGAAAAATLSPVWHARAHYPTLNLQPGEPDTNTYVLTGRAIHALTFYEEPDIKSKKLNTLARDQSCRILGEVRAPFSRHNDLWYKTDLGYVHSAWVLPMRIYPPQPFIADIGPWGFWGEISQVYTDARVEPSAQAAKKYRFYGSTMFHVIEATTDAEGTGWYKVNDDYPPKVVGNFQWVLARDVRRFPRVEMAPIHPFVGNKRIVVDLEAQSLTCFEGDTVVFQTLVASGLGGGLATPTGEHWVLLKQASRHMSNVPYEGMKEEDRPAPGDIFDLPGVPWNTFFDMAGTAIHGAYWHNDFGVRRSHGCLNVSCEAARWIYRWVHPIGGYEDEFIRSDRRVGTPINIV
ncbi:MAG TPA: L,D-transpeptidase [Anaerolineae bacterium]|mgnify:FL=1|nr:L,D-transpeptidase [Anaerolineae bacterium]HQI84858.1 L,D-transpeptidase [Anaerolineae bacterium]